MGHKKLFLDLVMGAAIPMAILHWGTDYIGARPSFIAAGVIPAVYVLLDVLFFSKRFNAITTIVAITATTQGGLAFLKVDGWKYALQDTAGTIVTFLLFAITLALGKPMVDYFAAQVLAPADEAEEKLIWQMLLRPGPIRRAVVIGTLIIMAEQLARGTGNYFLNLYRVTAEFGTSEFNNQKAAVTGIATIPFTITNFGALIIAVGLVIRTVDRWLDDAAETGGTLGEQITRKLSVLDGTTPPPSATPTKRVIPGLEG